MRATRVDAIVVKTSLGEAAAAFARTSTVKADSAIATCRWPASCGEGYADLTTGLECFGSRRAAHHDDYDVTADQMKDWANMMELLKICPYHKDTTVESLEQQLFLNDLAWKLKG